MKLRIIDRHPKKTFAELFRQFKAPLALALVWTGFKLWQAAPIGSVSSFLATLFAQFSASFFFLSWLWGQYNRVDRQQDTTERLQIIQASLVESQEATARLVEMQTQQQTVLSKLASIDTNDAAFRPAFFEASRLSVESNALSARANTATLTALGGIIDGGLFANLPPATTTHSPPGKITLEGSKPEH